MSKKDIQYSLGSATIPPKEVKRISKMTIEEFINGYAELKKIEKEYLRWIIQADEIFFGDGAGKLGEVKHKK